MTPLRTKPLSESGLPQAPAAGERRRLKRIPDSFPVLIEPADRRFTGSLSGSTRDYDQAGACVRARKPLPEGAKVRVRTLMPRTMSEFFRGMKIDLPAKVRCARPGPDGAHEVILAWDKPLEDMLAEIVRSHQRRIGAAVALTLALVIWLRYASLDYFWYSPVFFVYSTALASFLLSRFFISWAHEPPPMTGYTPPISVVVSVRNEQDAISRTIDMIYQSEYPENLREVIVADDGSSDGTPKALEELRRKYSSLRVLSLPPKGKRHAMAAGVKAAKGEIIVFVDSDTFVMHDTLRQIVCGFEDPTLGASAGYTGVENSTANALAGMQEVRYYVSNRLLKSSESIFGCVTCCPGCLSAYRRAYLMEILDTWLNQTFLGAPATFGDDRSLTNFILRKYRVIYNDRAVASTIVPVTWSHYMRQQLRWKKSWLRETWIASGFMYRKHPIAVLSFYASSFFSLMSPVMLARVLFLEGRGESSVLLFYMTGLFLIAMLQSLYFLYKRPSPNWALGMLWMASSLLIMGPQTYYALLTVRKNHWGTR